MINLYSLDSKSFKIEDSIVPRKFEVRTKGGIIILRDIFTGNLITLDYIDNILIDGLPASFEILRKLVYNFSCNCIEYSGNPIYKIFDTSFDKTFI